MKHAFATFFILISLSFLAAPIHAAAPFSECHSERKGYCVRLTPPTSQSAQRGRSSSLLLAAASDIPFPGLEFLKTFGVTFGSSIGQILSAVYNFGVGIAGLSALVMLSYAGMLYMVGGAAPSALSESKRRLGNALIGLALIAVSYLLLYTINPDFTHTLKIEKLEDALGNKAAAPPASAPPAPPEGPPT